MSRSPEVLQTSNSALSYASPSQAPSGAAIMMPTAPALPGRSSNTPNTQTGTEERKRDTPEGPKPSPLAGTPASMKAEEAPVSSKKARNAPIPPLSTSNAYVTEDTTLAIPRASIKRIMKLDPDTKQLSQDAIMVMAKATELFIDKLAKASHSMAVTNKRKTIKYEDIADARFSQKNMEFLDGVVPQIP